MNRPLSIRQEHPNIMMEGLYLVTALTIDFQPLLSHTCEVLIGFIGALSSLFLFVPASWVFKHTIVRGLAYCSRTLNVHHCRELNKGTVGRLFQSSLTTTIRNGNVSVHTTACLVIEVKI